MIKFHELKVGDIVLASFDGQRFEGEVRELNREDKEVCVGTEVQDFWYKPEDLYPIPLDAEQMDKLYFQHQDGADGSIKYMKGPFRILLSQKGNFSNFEMWYREDRRHITEPLSVHELQNHYRQMTKIELTREPMAAASTHY
jgi:hypothetical protein